MKSLSKYFEIKDKICVYRKLGGLGDILMHRMLFEDMKSIWDNCNITFACPSHLHEAVIDHPYIDKIIDFNDIIEEDYIEVFDTSSACYRTEIREAPYCKTHRSDIWANKIGIELKNHNMNIVISDEEQKWARQFSNNLILIAPVSAMSSKNIFPEQILPIKTKLEDMGFKVLFLHNKNLPDYGETLYNINIRQMLSIINHAKLTIAADTSAFHASGGLNKPTVGIFGWADGKVYSKYYKNSVIVQRHREDELDWTCGPCFNFHGCTKCKLEEIRKPCITSLDWQNIWDGVKLFL